MPLTINRTTVALALVLGTVAGGTVMYFSIEAGRTKSPENSAVALPSQKKSDQYDAPPPVISQREMAVELQKGGYILYFRHAQRSKWDTVLAFDIYEMATGVGAAESTFRDAVCLTAQGREEAKMIGKLFELAKIPIGAVAASPSCRARQTGELAFGHVDVISKGLAHTPVTNARNAGEFSAELQKLLNKVRVEPGKNAAIAGHGNTLENNKKLFVEGTFFLGAPAVSETGFWVIKREQNGALKIVQRYLNIGEFAVNAVDLEIDKS